MPARPNPASETDLALAQDDLPSSGLLSFYDRLRARVERAVADRGRFGRGAAQTLLLVPDVFALLARLSLDREVPAASRALIGGALAYFVLPVDLFPEAVLGIGGFAEDLVVAAAVLNEALGPDLERYAERHWSGSERLRKVLTDLATASRTFLGGSLYDRVRRMLARRGVQLEP